MISKVFGHDTTFHQNTEQEKGLVGGSNGLLKTHQSRMCKVEMSSRRFGGHEGHWGKIEDP